jgi:hypothetical protein
MDYGLAFVMQIRIQSLRFYSNLRDIFPCFLFEDKALVSPCTKQMKNVDIFIGTGTSYR